MTPIKGRIDADFHKILKITDKKILDNSVSHMIQKCEGDFSLLTRNVHTRSVIWGGALYCRNVYSKFALQRIFRDSRFSELFG